MLFGSQVQWLQRFQSYHRKWENLSSLEQAHPSPSPWSDPDKVSKKSNKGWEHILQRNTHVKQRFSIRACPLLPKSRLNDISSTCKSIMTAGERGFTHFRSFGSQNIYSFSNLWVIWHWK